MTYQNFTDYPLWKEASELADSVFDFSRNIEDFSLRNRMTAAAIEIPFMIGEAAQSDSDETMKNRLWKVEDPVNELRSVLTESEEQGFAPHLDYAMMQERCRNLFRKVHKDASAPAHKADPIEEVPNVVEDDFRSLSPAEPELVESPPPAKKNTTEKTSETPAPPKKMDLNEDDFEGSAMI